MNDIRKFIVTGRMGSDPDYREFETGTKSVAFSLASSRFYSKDDEQQQDTQWYNIVGWNRHAEYARDHLKKGTGLYIEGDVRTRIYQDKSNKDVYITEVHIQEFKVIHWPKGSPAEEQVEITEKQEENAQG